MKHVDTIDITEVRRLAWHESISHAERERLDHLLSYTTDQHWYADTPPCGSVSHIQEVDIRAMLESGNFARVTSESPMAYAKLFSVPEPDKNRRRSILWPEAINARLRGTYVSHIGDCLDACSLGTNRAVRVFDLSSGFYQVPLADEVSLSLAAEVSTGNESLFLRPTRLPMGITYAPDLLELIVKIVAKVAIATTDPTVSLHVHVDNIRFAGPDKARVDAVAEQFRSLAQSISMSIKDEDPSTFLGANYDYAFPGGVRVQPAEKTSQKLRTLADITLNSPLPMWGAVREMFSLAVYTAPGYYASPLHSTLTSSSTFAGGQLRDFARRPARPYGKVLSPNGAPGWIHSQTRIRGRRTHLMTKDHAHIYYLRMHLSQASAPYCAITLAAYGRMLVSGTRYTLRVTSTHSRHKQYIWQ